MIRFFVITFFFIVGFTIGNAVFADDDDTIKSESTIISDGTMDTTINSPPPSAISPQISASNSDLCTVGVAGAVQTQSVPTSVSKAILSVSDAQA